MRYSRSSRVSSQPQWSAQQIQEYNQILKGLGVVRPKTNIQADPIRRAILFLKANHTHTLTDVLNSYSGSRRTITTGGSQ